MNCERYQNEIEDFLYGELTERRAAEIRAHLSDCSACARMRDQIERENEVFTQFYEESEIEPTSEMWESIRARLEAEPRRVIQSRGGFRSAFGWLLRPAVLRQAFAALLLIALSVATTIYFTRRGSQNNNKDTVSKVATTPTLQPNVTGTPPAAPSPEVQNQKPGVPQTPDRSARPLNQENRQPARVLSDQELIYQQIARAEREYRSAIRLLDVAIAKRRDSLDPAVMREYAASLALIDDSIANSRRALRERPDD